MVTSASREAISERRIARQRWWSGLSGRVPQEALGSITTRLALFAVLLVSLTAALIGTLSYTRARHALEAEAQSRLALLAHDVAEHLHRELEDRVADITNWAHLELMRAVLYHDVDKELAQFLRQIVGAHEVYRAITCTGTDGEVIAAAGDALPAFAAAAPAPARVSVVPPASGGDGRSLLVTVAIADPEHPGATIGILSALLEPQRLLDTIAASTRRAGGRDRLTVRGRNGDVILASGGASSPEDPSGRESGSEEFLQGVAGVGALSGADGPELEVVVEEPADVALADVSRLRATLLRVGALVLILSSVLAVLLAWWISEPVRRLTAAVRRITARGRLEEPIELPRAAGEIGVLASAFRGMVESLSAAQAEALVQSRRAFLGEIAANIAHEVRTPLSVLKTSAQLLARQELPPDEQRRLASNVAAEVDRLNGVVTSLVDLARPRPVRYRGESLAEVVDRAVTFFAPQADKLGVTISRAVDASVRVYGSADQLYQVFLNGIHNALQAMGGAGRLTVRCFREDGWGVVEIEDTGPGFAPAVIAKAFSPFCSTKADGTGLGLAISKRIVEEHGGTIAVENPPAGGARLRIRVPHRGDAP